MSYIWYYTFTTIIIIYLPQNLFRHFKIFRSSKSVLHSKNLPVILIIIITCFTKKNRNMDFFSLIIIKYIRKNYLF